MIRWWQRESRSLRYLLMLTVLAGMAIPSSLTVYLERLRLTVQFAAELEQDLVKTTTRYAEAVKDAVWQVSAPEAEAIIAAALVDIRVTRVEVRDDKDRPFVTVQREGAAAPEAKVHTVEMTEGERKVGTLAVTMDAGGNQARLDEAFLLSLRLILQPLLVALVLIGFVFQLRLIRPIQQLVSSSTAMAEGRLNDPFVALRHDEIGQLAQSLESTRQALLGQFHRLDDEAALKSLLVEFSVELQKALDYREFSAKVMLRIQSIVDVSYGALYVVDGTQTGLQAVAGYGVGPEELPSVLWGDGLIGQCARGGKRLVVHGDKGEQIRVRIGLGVLSPRSLAFIPIVHTSLLGVVVLGSTAEFNEAHLDRIETWIPTVAINLELLLSKLESQRQSEVARETELWYRAALGKAPVGLVVMETEGNLVLANERAETLLGYPAGGLVGLPLSAVFPSWLPRDGQHLARHRDGSELSVLVEHSLVPSTVSRRECYCLAVSLAGRGIAG